MERLLFPGFCEKAIVDHSSHVTEAFSRGQRSARASLLVGDAGSWLAASLRSPAAAFSAAIAFNWCVHWCCISEAIMDKDQRENQRKKALDLDRTRAQVRTFVYRGQVPFSPWSFRERWTERESEARTRNADKAAGGIVSLETVKSPRRAQPTCAYTQHTHNSCRGLSVAN